MFGDLSEFEFPPADIALFAKWFGWVTPPEHLNNDADLLDREQWFWVPGEALDALEESLWDQSADGEVPLLLPEDLPSPDGIMLLANPLRLADANHKPRRRRRRKPAEDDDAAAIKNLIAVRWTARSGHLIVQAVYGDSMLGVMRKKDPSLQPGDLIYGPPPEAAVQPGAWKQQERPMRGLRHAPRNCSDGSPLLLLFQDARVWQWGRRPRPTGTDPDLGRQAELMLEAIEQARVAFPPAPAGASQDPALRDPLAELAGAGGNIGVVAAWLAGCADAHSRGGDALNEFQAAVGRVSAKMPIMAAVPGVGGFVDAVPAESVDLPDEDNMRWLVAQEPIDCHRKDAQLARLLHCLWGFASKPLPANAPRRITRDIPKHRRGANPNRAGIRVMVLREPGEPGDGVGAVGGRRKPRRHLVRGHWRRHWHPSIETHRIRWIAPHLRAGNLDDDATAGPRTVRRVVVPADSSRPSRSRVRDSAAARAAA